MEDVVPMYLSIGVSYDRIMDSCPVELEPFVKSYKLVLENQNRMFHRNGLYIRDAIMSTIGNSGWFKGRGKPPHEYPKEPYPMFKDERPKEVDIQKEVELFYAKEAARRASWKMTHKKKNNQGEGEP